MAIPPSAALESHKRVIDEVQSTKDMVLLPEVCTKYPTFSGMSSLLSRPDFARTVGPYPGYSQALHWLTASRRSPLLCQRVLSPQRDIAEQMSLEHRQTMQWYDHLVLY